MLKKLGTGNGGNNNTSNSSTLPQNTAPQKVTDLKVFQGNKKNVRLTPDQLEELREELKDYKVTDKTTDKDPGFQKIAGALIECDGFLMKSAIRLGISYSRMKKLFEKYPRLHEITNDATQAMLDLAETKLKDKVLMGDLSAIIFTLKCKGSTRGWREDGSGIKSDEKPVAFKYEVIIPENFELVPKKNDVPKDKAINE